MFHYNYSRTKLVTGGFDINNPKRLTIGGEQIDIAKEIQQAFPNKPFLLHCNESTCSLGVEVALSSSEITTLDQVVSDHINNI